MSRVRLLLVLLVGAGAGAGVTYFAGVTYSVVRSKIPPEAVVDGKAEAPPYRGLDANLYMQISAEYRAACYQTYHFAYARLIEILRTRVNDGHQVAIVLDLDETVFDNGAFQAKQVKSGAAFDQNAWEAFEEHDHALIRLVPGAKDFLVAADKLGLALVYISNRNDKFRESTLAAIRRLGLPLPGVDRVKLATEKTGSNKDSRRKEAFDQFDVVMLVGDNLRDFDDKPFRSAVDNTKVDQKTDDPAKLAAAIEARNRSVDELRGKFGTTWILLPNPAYGEWAKVLGHGAKDTDLLK